MLRNGRVNKKKVEEGNRFPALVLLLLLVILLLLLVVVVLLLLLLVLLLLLLHLLHSPQRQHGSGGIRRGGGGLSKVGWEAVEREKSWHRAGGVGGTEDVTCWLLVPRRWSSSLDDQQLRPACCTEGEEGRNEPSPLTKKNPVTGSD